MSVAALFRRKPIEASRSELHRTLGVVDLTAFGIAATLGAGIFSTIGGAAAAGGPAVVLLFVFTAIACGFAALCYAELAGAIPVAGSAYTYAYHAFGELAAWILGWDLLMEYAIGNIAVAIAWSDYFTDMLARLGAPLPPFLTTDPGSAAAGHAEVLAAVAGGMDLSAVPSELAVAFTEHRAYVEAPRLLGIRLVCDLPAFGIALVVTALVFLGIGHSRAASNLMVALKLAVVGLVIAVGASHVDAANYRPFAPNGFAGVLRGASGVFFAYIGFDALATTAEECQNPQRDLPRAMMATLVVCTVLYVAIALVLVGIVPYGSLDVGDPLAFAFGEHGANLPVVHAIVSGSAVVAMTSVLLVFQLGQPRTWMAMSRDGLLPPLFGAVHPRFRTPWFATLVAGVVVAVPSLFLPLSDVTDLTSIGTLFAFVFVAAGVLALEQSHPDLPRRFRVPYVSSRYVVPVGTVLGWVGYVAFAPERATAFFSLVDLADASREPLSVLAGRLPMFVFLAGEAALAVLCALRALSLVPVLAVLTCGYLLTELGPTNWLRFGAWLVAGLVVYVAYGRRHSRLARTDRPAH